MSKIFIQNKYLRIYNQICERSRHRETPDCYTEKHHVIPKSIGGNNSTENLVVLTGREHFICHYLLTKFTEGEAKISMTYALMQMINTMKNQRYQPCSRSYQKIREAFSKVHSEFLTGRTRKKHTEETKKKISESRRGIGLGSTHSEETKKKISESAKGKPGTWNGRKHSEESKRLMSEKIKAAWKRRKEKGEKFPANFKGRNHTDQAKQQISKSLKAKN